MISQTKEPFNRINVNYEENFNYLEKRDQILAGEIQNPSLIMLLTVRKNHGGGQNVIIAYLDAI